MPISINLLAEQQAAEEQRRRDPVKRATWAVGAVVALLLLWSGYLQVRLMAATREVNRFETEWKNLEVNYSLVSSNLNRVADAERKASALRSLATNRFLWAPVLNALQYTLVDNVQITRLKTDQTYRITEATKASTNKAGGLVKAKPAQARETTVMTLEANDYSSNPGEQITRFQEKLNGEPFFKTNLQKSELTGRSPPQVDPGSSSRQFVHFTLECQFLEKVR